MLLNYLKVCVRVLRKNHIFTGINIAGLAIATTAALLIFHYVRFEHSYENFHQNADNLYRVTLDLYREGEFIVTDCETYPPAGPALKEQMTEVVEYIRLQHIGPAEIGNAERLFSVDRIYAADPSVFTAFSYTLVQGDPLSVFREPWQVVLTESVALKYFGSTQVLGKTLLLKPLNEPLSVVGIIQDVPENTHLKFDVLISFVSLEKHGWDMNSWGGNNNYTYLQMQPGTDLDQFNNKLRRFSQERLKNEIMTAEPIKDIHLYSQKTFEPEVNGDAQTVAFLSIIAGLILIIGWINSINLTTARTIERTKEVGIRKTLGSSRLLLINQFLLESLLINGCAFALSLLLIEGAMPAYLSLLDKPIPVNIFLSVEFWLALVSLFLLSSLLVGLYPAIVLSSAKPTVILRRTFTSSSRSAWIRKGLVISEFAASFVLLAATIIVYQQIQFMRNQPLGLNMQEVLVVRGPSLNWNDASDQHKVNVFRNEISRNPHIQSIAASMSLPGVSLHELNTSSGIKQYGQTAESGYNYYIYSIDAQFIPAMEINMLAGRNFYPGVSNSGEVIINEEAARLLGFRSPEEAIGGKITLRTSSELEYSTIVGVLANYHQRSLKEKHLPLIHSYTPEGRYYSLKLKTATIHQTLAEVEEVWNRLFPGQAFDYYFLDDKFNQQYKSEAHFGKITGFFAGLAIFIASLGLFGLVSYATTQRTKEIGIRKVLGASVSNILLLLSSDFLKLVILAVVIASPIAWYAMNRWLANFAYRIEIQWWVFALAGMLALFIALCTISLQAWKAARANPVDALRNE